MFPNRILRAALAVAAASSSAFSQSHTPVSRSVEDAPLVFTSYGPITGISTSTGYAYLGVPFAKAMRWGAPLAPPTWDSPLNCSAFQAGCVQFDSDGVPAVDDEDCLYVNVFVPKMQATGFPMIVWIHGGGFIGGDQNGDLSAYAAQSGAVIVSVSYRLGVLGFMNLDGMALAYPTPSDPAAAIPNVGLLDQQVALQWASANAAAFGADPANVLLTGQSAGGSSVLFQLTLQGSAGTFKSAIPMSPGSPVNTMAAGQATAAAIAAKLNCPSSTMNFTQQMACLRSVSSSDIVNAGIAVAGTYNLPLTLGPTIDGALVKVAPITAILDVTNTSGGWFNTEAAVVVTETLFEGDALLVGYMHNTTFNATQAQQSLVEFGTMVGFNSSVNDELGSLYAAIGQRDGLFNGSTRMWGDGLLACCSYWAALGASQRSTHPVYRLLWNTTLSQQYGGAQPGGRSTHGTDLPFYFESQSYFSPLEQLVQSDWYKVLINLATAADVNTGPAGQSLPLAWPAYQPNSSQPTMLVVNELRNYSLIDGWQEEFCASWLPVLP